MANMSTKFDPEAHNGLVAVMFTSLYVHCDFDLWLPSSKINRAHPLTMVNISVKFDKEIHNSLVSIVFESLFPYTYVHCDLDLWPPKINRVHPLTMANMSTKCDQEAHSGLVAIVFTSLLPYIFIVTLTFDLWPPKTIGCILLPWLTCTLLDQT